MKGGITSQQIRRALKNNRDNDGISIETTKEIKIVNEYNSNINKLYKNSLYIPDQIDVNNQTAFVRGGIRFGGRYPDIIINDYDYERAKNFLTTLMIDSFDVFDYSLKIVRWVQSVLQTRDFVKISVIYGGIVPNVHFYQWGETFDSSTTCINKLIPRPNSFTNITGIPYVFGDCREHGLLTTFLCKVYSEMIGDTRDFRIIYTKGFILFEDEQIIKSMGDHVFGFFKYNNELYVIDALYESENNDIYVNQNLHKIDFVNKSEYQHFEQPENFQTNEPIIYTGNVYINGKSHKILSIPIIWKNEIEFIDNSFFPNLTYSNILLYNRLFKYDGYSELWQTHREWCDDAARGNKSKRSKSKRSKSKRSKSKRSKSKY
jgi:hypothetical protein